MNSFFYFAPLVLFAAQIGVLIYMQLQMRRQKAHQDRLVNALPGMRCWRIVIARPAHLKTLWKLLPGQARGVLVDEGDCVRIQGHWRTSDTNFETVVAKDAAQAAWHGNSSITSNNLHWAALHTPIGELAFTADTGLLAAGSREALSDIFRAVFPHAVLPSTAGQDFALEKNPRSLAAVVALFALASFALIDTYVITRYELIEVQLLQWLTSPIIVIAAALAMLALGTLIYRGLVTSHVPSRESLVLSFFVAGAAAGAFVPLLKRVDQALAERPSQPYRYRVMDSIVNLAPMDAQRNLPKIRFTQAKEYWAQFPMGTEVDIPLLHGPLGLWQLDHELFDPAVLDFYERQETQAKH